MVSFFMKSSEANPDNSTNANADIVTSTKPQVIAPTIYQVFCLKHKYFIDVLLIFQDLWVNSELEPRKFKFVKGLELGSLNS